jgi:hypothetical protein
MICYYQPLARGYASKSGLPLLIRGIFDHLDFMELGAGRQLQGSAFDRPVETESLPFVPADTAAVLFEDPESNRFVLIQPSEGSVDKLLADSLMLELRKDIKQADLSLGGVLAYHATTDDCAVRFRYPSPDVQSG